MNKILSAFLVALSLLFCSNQANALEIAVSYGGYTASDTGGYYQDDWKGVKTAWGALTASLYVPVAKKFSIGPSYTFSSAVTKGGSNHSSLFYHTILFNGKYNYFQKGILTLYGHLGLGVEITQFDPKWDDNYTEAYFGYQVSPIGINARLANGFSIFGELGFGNQGLIQAGFSYSF